MADPGPVRQVHPRNWDLLFSHMLLSPSLIAVCVFLGSIYVCVVQCVCVFVQCVYPDTGPLCSPAGWLTRSYSNNHFFFYPSLSFSLLIHFVWPPPHHHQQASDWLAWNNLLAFLPLFFFFKSPVLTDRSNSGSLSPVLTLISIHWYASRICVTVIRLITSLESLTPSLSQPQDVFLPFEIIAAHFVV